MLRNSLILARCDGNQSIESLRIVSTGLNSVIGRGMDVVIGRIR